MNKELLKRAQDALAIEDVYLRECHACFHGDFDPTIPDQEIAVQVKIGLKRMTSLEVEREAGQKATIVRFEMDTGIRLVSPDATEETLRDPKEAGKYVKAEVTAVFVAAYLKRTDVEKPVLEEFGKVNVGYHVWPYWRELVQSVCGRMRLPSVVLPMFILGKDPMGAPSKPKSSADAGTPPKEMRSQS